VLFEYFDVKHNERTDRLRELPALFRYDEKIIMPLWGLGRKNIKKQVKI